MRRLHTINLIAFCVLVLFADDNSASIFSHVRKYIPILLRNPLKELKALGHGIVPGTLWCGPGHIANNYSELGINWKLDTCCRAHDFCNDYIKPRQTKYGLYNSDRFCRSSLCECDLQFYDCLKKAPGFVAFNVGKIYFKRCKQCFSTYYDVETCTNMGLVVSEGVGRNNSRAFCAQFDRNPKWGHPRNVANPESIPTAALPTWFDGESEETVPLSLDTWTDNQAADRNDDTSSDFDMIDMRTLNVS